MTEIDVSGCNYYKPARYGGIFSNTTCFCNGKNTPDKKCEDNKDCYYKQLKRLEQENAELKEMLSKEPKAMQAFQIAYNGLKKDNEVLWGMVKDYKTALEEIKKISKLAFAVCDDDCGNANKFMDIINKVSEVLKDE